MPAKKKASKRTHRKWIELGNKTPSDKYTGMVDPRDVKILEQGKMVPLIWDVTDEWAVDDGCLFDVDRAYHFRDVCHNYLRLWQGESHGQPAILEEDWQWPCFARALGWVAPNKMRKAWLRRFRDMDVWISKKNKKMNHPLERIPTPEGWRRFIDLKVGDRLFDSKGKVCRVVEEHPLCYDEEWYEVQFSHGVTIRCNGDHLWQTEATDPPEGSRVPLKQKKNERKQGVWSTREIRQTLYGRNGTHLNHRVALHKGIEIGKKSLPVDPYLLGLWLGDGTSTKSSFTAVEADGKAYNQILDYRRCSFRLEKQSSKHTWTIVPRKDYEVHSLTTCDGSVTIKQQNQRWLSRLRELNLYDNKRIPDKYLFASRRQREDLLCGLMDTDGTATVNKKNGLCTCSFWNKNEVLIDQVGVLLSSLGVKYRKRFVVRNSVKYYALEFHPVRHCQFFKLPRKLEKTQNKVKKLGRSRAVYIKDIVPCTPETSRCITVDSPDGTYLVGKSMIPTHNSSSGAMLGIYLWRFDGEPGQRVFSAAKDGRQAMRIHEHALGMVQSSPFFQRELESKKVQLDKTTKTLTYHKNLSTYEVLHGDNYKATEGLNGCYLMDEVHVVPEKLANAMDDMGASRVEPFNGHFSTAGNDPNTYGRRRYETDKKILEGKLRTTSRFVKIYEAPQTLNDSELDNIEYWKAANPSWGYTIDPDRFAQKFREARNSTRQSLASFKQRRLGIWQRSAVPWIYERWLECGDDTLTLNDFVDRGGGIGLDVSVRQDITAIVFATKDNKGKTIVWPELWLTEEQFEATSDLVNWEDFIAADHLYVVPGAAINADKTWKSRLYELVEIIRPAKLLGDDTYTGTFFEEFEERTGIETAAVTQSNTAYAAMTESFEELVVEQKLRHPNNSCLNWQFQVCLLKEIGDKKRPIKDKNNPHEKVDGVQATIMAVEAMTLAGTHHSPYNDPEYRIPFV
jgi:phage terminase large subunit-like protein